MVRWLRSSLALALLATFLLIAALPVGAQDDWSEVVRGDPESDMVALTFDAGGVAGPAAARILEVLGQHGLRVTFFLSGRWVEDYPDLASQLVVNGHELANHSYDHPDFSKLGDDEVLWQLEHTEDLVHDILGRNTRPWFRFPFGSRNPRVMKLVNEAGFRSVYWTLDSGDWRSEATADEVAQRVLRHAAGGYIVVHHIASQATADALPYIIEGLAERGLRIVTVSELLGFSIPGPTPTATPMTWPEC